jgi:galactonate dehydratase
MKITSANIFLFDTGLPDVGSIKPVIVELVTDAGITGAGEAGTAYFTGGLATAAMIKEIAESYVLGKDPLAIRSICSDICSNSFWTKGGGAITFAGISAVEMALWDIAGKALNAPVYQLFGGKVRDRVRVYANWSMSYPCLNPEDFVRKAIETADDGFDALKLYPLNIIEPRANPLNFTAHRNVDRAAERRCIDNIKAVRTAIGDDIELTADLCGNGTTEVMLRLGKALEDFDLFFLEEPVDAFDIEGYSKISAKLNIPIAAGERFYTLAPFRRILENRAVDFVQPNPGVVGGLMETERIASLAESSGVKIAPHNSAGPILTAACLQLDACLPNFSIQEIFPYRPDIFYQIVKNAPEREIVDSYWTVGDAPGLGVELDHDTVDDYVIYKCERE